jgi:hypothetical protein
MKNIQVVMVVVPDAVGVDSSRWYDDWIIHTSNHGLSFFFVGTCF